MDTHVYAVIGLFEIRTDMAHIGVCILLIILIEWTITTQWFIIFFALDLFYFSMSISITFSHSKFKSITIQTV